MLALRAGVRQRCADGGRPGLVFRGCVRARVWTALPAGACAASWREHHDLNHFNGKNRGRDMAGLT